MRSILVGGSLLMACVQGAEPASEPTRAPNPAVIHVDAARAPLVTMPAELARLVGSWDGSENELVLDGSYAYLSTSDGRFRIARTGGALEPVARLGGAVDGRAVHRGVEYVFKRARPRGAGVQVYRVAGGKRVLLGAANEGLAAKYFAFDDEYLYWNALETTGEGAVFATRLRDGDTKRLIACAVDDTGMTGACPDVLRGSPPMASFGAKLYRLSAGRAVPVPFTCRPNPNVEGEYWRPAYALGDAVLCCFSEAGWGCYGGHERERTLLSVGDGSSRSARGLGDDATFVRGHWYHTGEAGIMRRATLDSADEIVVALPPRSAARLVADDEGLVWIYNDRIWSAPLPRP